MRLLRFGNIVVNIERVNSIEINRIQGWALLYFSAPLAQNGIDSIQPDYTKFVGLDVEYLERWLADNCEVMRYPEDPSKPAVPPERNDIPC